MSVTPENAIPVVWRTAEARSHDIQVWNTARWYAHWADVEAWYAYWTWINAQRIPYDPAHLEALHHCEEGNDWYANGSNPADPAHQTFQGGLGMSVQAWQLAVDAARARGVTLPASALAATPDQQMQGAQALGDRYGWGGWACKV